MIRPSCLTLWTAPTLYRPHGRWTIAALHDSGRAMPALAVCAILWLTVSVAGAHTTSRTRTAHAHTKKHHFMLRGCLSAGAVIPAHNRSMHPIGHGGRLFAPVGHAMYYTDAKGRCMPGKHARHRG
ncbi:hypothetical protein [Acetobacter nitrogenifigens]